jgi:ABC-2 type transport system permease protein
MKRSHPFWQLFIARIREFHREPEVIFWMFGFPVLLTIALGVAFREKPAEDALRVGVLSGDGASAIASALGMNPQMHAEILAPDAARTALRMGRISVLVEPPAAGRAAPRIQFDPTRPDAVVARRAAEDALQRAAGRQDAISIEETTSVERGGRYIDFLVPGLMGMNIMAGGMWGVGFVLVDMRMRKFLKRLVATPMRKSHFLGAVIGSRMTMVTIELGLVMIFGGWLFGVPFEGSVLAVLALILLGSFSFCGLGLLVASRTDKIETASGLMNLVMMPMWVVSGIFFSADRFPSIAQPFIHILPLTALNDALRAVILEGASLPSQAARVAVLLVWGGLSFLAALKIFRWT